VLLLDDSAEQDVLRSELWTTLFRGGYMVGKLQRSLSGKFVRFHALFILFTWPFVDHIFIVLMYEEIK
jgi:hypothetical protein